MNYLGRVFGGLKGFYSGINGATLTGAIDVVIVEQEDGTFKCSPFHVRFGKLGVLRSREKIVDLEVNGEVAPIHLKLGDSGEAFFVQELDSDDEIDDSNLATSPISCSPRMSDSDNHLKLETYETEESITGDEKSNHPTLIDTATKIVIEVEGTRSLSSNPINTEETNNTLSNSNLINSSSSTSRNEDIKGRKRRRKKRRNQGSKSDIKVEQPHTIPQSKSTNDLPRHELENSNDFCSDGNETIFKMDEDLPFTNNEVSSFQNIRSIHRDFYSDTEVDIPNSRPSTPIQSDSELEITRVQKDDAEKDVGKWPWGELPLTNTPVASTQAHQKESFNTPGDKDVEKQAENKSVLAGMFSFIKNRRKPAEKSPPIIPAAATKTTNEKDTSLGIYLDDLNLENMDPEVAALYFPNFGRGEIKTEESVNHENESSESGKGSSLPQSPVPSSSPVLSSSPILTGSPILSSSPKSTSHHHCEKYKKALRLTSEQIESLNLRYGQNEAVFSVTTAYQGTSVARCHIYLWRYDDRVVISDIDGTITKSDVLGQILPIIGNDWAQSGVAQLFTQVHDNGYKMLYLSARAIGQASITREYLKSIRQGDVTLPDGPLLLNPTSLISALHREVIEKKPEEFKIACLNDVKTLFGESPFYAGYGNKINDVWAYRAVDIPISRIFTINHKGELRLALTNTFQSSYTSLVELAEHIFPAYKHPSAYSQGLGQMDKFNSFEYWRSPLQIVDELLTPEEEIKKEVARSRNNSAETIVNVISS